LADVRRGFEILAQQLLILYNTPECQRFLLYYESTWISGPSTFAPSVWNVHDATLKKIPRTNNASEGSNHALNDFVGATHPSLKDLIKALRRFNAKKETRLLQFLQSGSLSKEERPRKWWVEREARINNILNTYTSDQMFVTLKNLGYNYS
jgi:hypothetical protein